MSDDSLSVVAPPAADAAAEPAGVNAPADLVPNVSAADTPAPAVELPNETPPLDQRAAALEAIRTARDVPPGLRERLGVLVQQGATLDARGEPLLTTGQVLDLLAQGLPPALRTDPAVQPERPAHPAGDAFFAIDAEGLSDQQAEEIAREQLARAGLLRNV
jgi:hypothetical protein